LSSAPSPFVRRALPALLACAVVFISACGTIPFDERPAAGYVHGEPLRVAVIDETGGTDWSGALRQAVATYDAASPYLRFQGHTDGAHIVVRMRRYYDANPPALSGYTFPNGVGGFAAVYDTEGSACNFPPSPLPLNCNGEIARALIYLNDAIPSGSDIERRRQDLILHELGHAMGLTRHSPDLNIAQLAYRYGWD
jgi:hypothetical protein